MSETDADEKLFEVTVWDMFDGDIVKKLWEATEDDIEEIEENYGDDPRYSIDIIDIKEVCYHS